jgi:hypothetical protein
MTRSEGFTSASPRNPFLLQPVNGSGKANLCGRRLGPAETVPRPLCARSSTMLGVGQYGTSGGRFLVGSSHAGGAACRQT